MLDAADEIPGSDREVSSAESANKEATTEAKVNEPVTTPTRGLRFWAIMLAVAFAGVLTALEATITSTALPSIIADLGGGDLFIWAVNGYFLSMTALQPMFGQIANIFGRRWPMILATAAFTLGSGICGGATNIGMLVAGRVIQGAGAGGINVLIEIVICDLVPMRERGNFLAMIFGFVSLGTALGPLFGGLIVQNIGWRWVFWICLPIGGVALVLLVVFLQVRFKKEGTMAVSLGKIDWTGNIIFIGAISAILLALSWAGAKYPWASHDVLVPLIIGLAALVGFVFFEASRFAQQSMMPIHLISNRTSATAYVLTFLHSIVTMWAIYFLPVYFQGVLGANPKTSGIDLLPTILILIPFAVTGGVLLSNTGKYLFILISGFALMVVGFGLFSLLDEKSSTGAWVGFQIIESAGAGLVTPALLPAVLAPLSDRDTALATALWAFCRSFGMTWGTAIGAAVFNNRFGQLVWKITDPAVAVQVSGGNAYQLATKAFLDTLPAVPRSQLVWVVMESLKRSWFIAIAFAGVGFWQSSLPRM